METSVFKQAVKLLREQKKYRRWLTTFLCLAVLVTLGTVAALKMNGQALNHKKQVLNCQLEIHEHTDSCYDGEKLVCGYADYVVHTHNDDCYGADGELVCQLPEVEAHEHTEDCYEEEKVLICGLEESETEVHEHTEDCYIKEKGELICGEEEGGGAEVDSSSDESESSEDSDGGEEAEDGENEEPEARSEESSGHEHTDDCYEWNDVLACEAGSGEEGHIHTDECYETRTVLTCGKAELHTHDESCYDENGNLTCGLLEVKEHIHGEECFETVDMTDEEVAGLNAKLTKTFEDDYVRVTAEYSESADLPKDAVLKVEQITDEEHFAEREAQLREEMDDENVTMGALMNIGFYVTDEETGKDVEVEPKDAVSITIQFLDDEGFAEGDPVTIVHFADEGMEMLDGSKIDKEKATTFEMSSFSDIAVLNDNSPVSVPLYQKNENGVWETLIDDCRARLYEINQFDVYDAMIIEESGKSLKIQNGFFSQLIGEQHLSLITDGARWFACAIKSNGETRLTTLRYDGNIDGNSATAYMWLVDENADTKITKRDQIIGFYYLPENTNEYVNVLRDQIGNNKSFQVVFNPSNGTGRDNYPVQYAGWKDKDYVEIPRTTLQISEDVVEEDKITIKLPSNSDLNKEFEFFKKDDKSISDIVHGSQNEKYKYKLVGWYNIGTRKYYSVENGFATAEINMNDRNIFYADWIAADYNFHDANREWDVIKTEDTNDFITTRIYDYNDLFNLYSANVNINGNTEEWSDSGNFNETATNSMLFLTPNNQGGNNKGPLGYPSNPEEWNESQANKIESVWNLKDTKSLPLAYLFPDDDSDKYGVHFVGYGNYLYKRVVDSTDNTENQIGRYVYNSNDNAAAYQQDGDGGRGRFYIYNTKERIIDSTTGNPKESFLPFNKVNSDIKDNNDAEINYGFGIRSEINFYLPADTNEKGSDGKYGNQVDGKEMLFSFSGDDDLWVFLDDNELLLDLGGIHPERTGWINFSTGEINANGVTTTFNAKKGSHKLTVFYMERGAGLSNCKIEFNIVPRYKIEKPKADTVTVKKEWKNDEKNANKPQSVDVALFNGNEQIGESVTLKGDDWSYAWEGLPVGSDYEVREINSFPKYTPSTALTTTDSYDYWAETTSMETKDIIILNNGAKDGIRYALGGSLETNEVNMKEGIILSESVTSDIIWKAESASGEKEGYYLKNNSGKYLKLPSGSATLSLMDTKEGADVFEIDDHIGAGLSNGSYRIIFENQKFSCQVCNNNDDNNDNSKSLRVAVYMKQNLSSEVKNYTITNTYTPDITINKVDSENPAKLLMGAAFKLTRVIKAQSDEDGEDSGVVEYYNGTSWAPIGEGGEAATFTLEEGFKTLKDLPDANYTLTEVSAPTEGNYKPIDPENPIVINFEIAGAKINDISNNSYAMVTDNGLTLLVKNEKAPQKKIGVRFVKTDKVSPGSKSRLLDGAEFKLYQENANGNKVEGIDEKVNEITEGLKVSDENGIFYQGELEIGTYYLKEIKAPDGFELPAGIFKFTIETDDENVKFVYDKFSGEHLRNDNNPDTSGVYEIKVSNTPGYKLPETGGNGTIPITMGSAILMTVSAFLLYGYSMRQKKRERRSNK